MKVVGGRGRAGGTAKVGVPNAGVAGVDAYIAAAVLPAQAVLAEIRRHVRRAVPSAQEVISYQMPAFKQTRVFFFYAAFQRHIGVYPPLHAGGAHEALRRQLLPYANPKGNLRFPLSQPMPFDLLAQLAVALSEQYSHD